MGVAVAAFAVPNTFQSGATISASSMNTNFAAIADALTALETPAGTVTAFAGPTAAIPAGWTLCDGRTASRTEYARLFAAIGTVHGAGDKATTFNLPDYRGLFLRGVDAGRGRDPDASARLVAAVGGNAGDQVGSTQMDEFRSHNHAVGDYRGIGIATAKFGLPGGNHNDFTAPHRYNNGDNTVDPSDADAWHALASGGTETRPANAAVHFIIKL